VVPPPPAPPAPPALPAPPTPTPAEAGRLILEHIQPLAPGRVPLREALDLVLAEKVMSPIDLPAWDNSAMDGYACRAADVRGASAERPIELGVIETVPAGSFPEKAVGRGEATRIFTGAPLPDGADTVIRQEDTVAVANGRVAVASDRDAVKNVRRRGEDIRKGQVVLETGTPLGPAQLGVCASIAHGEPLVHRRPRVAFLGSGDEIVDLDRRDEILTGRKIATSNSYTVSAVIRRAGGEPLDLGVARDSMESLREHLAGAEAADLLVTTAGVSVGEHDLVRTVLTELGCVMKLWRIRMRPGAPLGFGLLNGKPWIGLPGNPVSTMVTFELFVRPAIRRMLGHALPFRRAVRVRLEEPITLGPRLRHFLRAVVTPAGEDGALVARLTGPQGSGILTSMAQANALLIVPEDRQAVPAGEMLAAILLDDPHHVADPPF
jgi:molybdopterin molybdotransferase